MMVALFEPVQILTTGQLGWVMDERGGPEGLTEYHIDGYDMDTPEWFREADLAVRSRPAPPPIGTRVRCYAQDCEVIDHDYAAGTVYLMAPMPDAPVERLHRYPAVPQAHLCVWHGESTGTLCAIADGAQMVALPDWVKLTFIDAIGTWADPENGDLRMALAGTAKMVFSATVEHQNNKTVYFGYGVDGALPVTFGSVRVKADTPTRMTVQRDVTVPAAGNLLAFYISSDFATKAVTWSDGELSIT